jgi:hypothetical protein
MRQNNSMKKACQTPYQLHAFFIAIDVICSPKRNPLTISSSGIPILYFIYFSLNSINVYTS